MTDTVKVCNKHVWQGLQQVLGEYDSQTLLVRRLDEHDAPMFCDCGSPADWYVRRAHEWDRGLLP